MLSKNLHHIVHVNILKRSDYHPAGLVNPNSPGSEKKKQTKKKP